MISITEVPCLQVIVLYLQIWVRLKPFSTITCTCVFFSVTQGLFTNLSPAPRATRVITIQWAARRSRTMFNSFNNLGLPRRFTISMLCAIFVFVFSSGLVFASSAMSLLTANGDNNVSHLNSILTGGIRNI